MYPPETISVGSLSNSTTVTWESESNGFCTGTEGKAVYTLEAGGKTSVVCKWNNPYWGDNGYSCDVEGDDASKYNASYSGGGGDNATVTMWVKAN